MGPFGPGRLSRRYRFCVAPGNPHRRFQRGSVRLCIARLRMAGAGHLVATAPRAELFARDATFLARSGAAGRQAAFLESAAPGAGMICDGAGPLEARDAIRPELAGLRKGALVCTLRPAEVRAFGNVG